MKYLIILFFFLPGCVGIYPNEVESITVLNNEFEIVSNLNAEQINNITSEWEGLISLSPPTERNWTHKIDIAATDGGGRWLYHRESGCLSKLNYSLKPSFKVRNIEAFNKNLGI